MAQEKLEKEHSDALRLAENKEKEAKEKRSLAHKAKRVKERAAEAKTMQVQTEKAITAIEEEKNALYQDRLALAEEKRKQR